MNDIEKICERINKYDEHICKVYHILEKQREDITEVENKMSELNLALIELKKRLI